MMASLVVQPLLEVVFDKLATPLLGELHSFKNFKKDIKRLQDQLLLIQAVIHDAEERQLRDETVRLWLQRLQSVAYEADDLLDELNFKSLQRQMNNNKVPFLAFLPNLDYFKMSSKLKNIRERIDDIAKEMSSFQFRDIILYRRYETSERRQTGHCVDESNVFGRDEDVNTIIQLLSTSSSSSSSSSSLSLSLVSDSTIASESVSVLPIVGMGAIGKTTVAQLVFNRIKKHFDLSIWVAVYDNFRVRKLINDILEGVSQGTPASRSELSQAPSSELSQLGVLQSQLQESLRSKRYLLVLDDVWNEDQGEWDKLKQPLSNGATGSKIIVTTRSKSVASLVGTYPPYNLQPLSDDVCWILFKSYAFANIQDEKIYPYLIPIGKEIVKKCGGVPLAARVIGSLLHSEREEREWSHVLHSEFWDLLDSSIMPALRLSYNHLYSHQKRCFSYCSVLPKNYEINREKIIQQWIAEGLIPSLGDKISGKKMEDTGNEYFNDLLSVSFFEGVSTFDDGKIKEFKIHSLIHDLAQYVSGTSPERAFHFSQGFDFSSNIPLALRRLRVLNLTGCGITRLHKSVGHLIYLRYLDISYNPIEKLPEEMCNLFNLQTLNLSGCRDLMELPTKLSNLINLRHLNMEDCVSLTRVPAHIGKLKNLQTLSNFIVGRTLEESLFQLVHLDLRGELKIKLLENVGNLVPDLCLQHKQLHFLALSWGYNEEDKVGRQSSRHHAIGNNGGNAEHVLNSLVPNRSLKSLHINEYSGTTFPQWMNKNVLPNLTKLVLANCRRCENLPTLGQLQFLKVLCMQGMNEVTKIGEEFYGKDGSMKPFPSLEELILQDFPDLRLWESTESLEGFPCLQRLSIIKCPRLENMPWFPSLQHLDMHDCNASILQSAKELKSLSTLIIHGFPRLSFIPKVLPLNNPHLTSLTISSCPDLCYLPASFTALTALQSLTIRWCEQLETLPHEFSSLTSLQTWEITECPCLKFLPEEIMKGLKSLRSLSIENCKNLSSLPKTMKYLVTLEHLTIMYCESLQSLPNGLQHLKSLRSLNILNCSGLVSLPEGLQHVSTLQNIEIRSCSGLQELPNWIENLVSLRSLAISDCENIKSLPEGLQRLIALQHLSIRDCPDLERRCEKEKGEDWHKISHVPYKYVGSLASQQGHDDASTSAR